MLRRRSAGVKSTRRRSLEVRWGNAAEPPAEPIRQLPVNLTPWKGDFDALLERRMIRVLIPYSRTLYFVDKGHERGVTAELARDFENTSTVKSPAGKGWSCSSTAAT